MLTEPHTRAFPMRLRQLYFKSYSPCEISVVAKICVQSVLFNTFPFLTVKLYLLVETVVQTILGSIPSLSDSLHFRQTHLQLPILNQTVLMSFIWNCFITLVFLLPSDISHSSSYCVELYMLPGDMTLLNRRL